MKEKDSIYVDTNVFIAWLVASHPDYKQARCIFKQYSKYQFYYSLLVIDEILFVMTKYRISKNIIQNIIKSNLIENPICILIEDTINHEQIEKYLNLWVNCGLKPRDALHYYYMKKMKITTIATFDQDFIRQQKKLGIKVLKY
ncbi:MAG: type II toxin-antitoxin system VapC family toxin [bacterium]